MPLNPDNPRLQSTGIKEIDSLIKEINAVLKKANGVREALKSRGDAIDVDGRKGADAGLKKVVKYLNNCQTKIEE